MSSFKRTLLENYFYGFITGLGVSGLIGVVYLKSLLGQFDAWIHDFMYGHFNAQYYNAWEDNFNLWVTLLLPVLAFLAAFIGIILVLSSIKEATQHT